MRCNNHNRDGIVDRGEKRLKNVRMPRLVEQMGPMVLKHAISDERMNELDCVCALYLPHAPSWRITKS
jgi:hypothetical protein